MAAPNPDSWAQSTTANRRIVLKARPRGAPTAGDFCLESDPIPTPAAGQALLQGKNFDKLIIQLAHE